MTSWRDTTSPEAQTDLDGLFDTASGLAQQQLRDSGQFYPYAVVVNTDGETEFVDASLAVDNDGITSVDAIAACREALIAMRNELRAAAVVADVRLAGGDAILVEVEHAQGTALNILQPYMKKRFGRGVQFGEFQASAGTRHVWVD